MQRTVTRGPAPLPACTADSVGDVGIARVLRVQHVDQARNEVLVLLELLLVLFGLLCPCAPAHAHPHPPTVRATTQD